LYSQKYRYPPNKKSATNVEFDLEESIVTIDCEFDGFEGELLSVALYSPKKQLYFVLDAEAKDPWVIENVTPYYNTTERISKKAAQKLLSKFLMSFKGPITIVADWPEDIRHFCDLLITGPGKMLETPRILQMVINRNLGNKKSKILHNALEDAKAIYVSMNEKS